MQEQFEFEEWDRGLRREGREVVEEAAVMTPSFSLSLVSVPPMPFVALSESFLPSHAPVQAELIGDVQEGQRDHRARAQVHKR